MASLVHPLLILASATARFRFIDIVYPVDAPKQPVVNVFGAVALYLLVITVVTSYFRFEIGRRVWKPLHYANYLLFATFAVHSVLTDPTLKDVPIDPFDAEKVFVELCVLLVLIGIGYRVRGALRRPPRRTHLPKRRRGREPLPPSSVDRILRE